MTLDFTVLFNNIDLSDLDKIVNSNFRKYKIQHSPPQYVDAKYFQTLTNFIIIRNNHLLQSSKLYLQKSGVPQGACTSSVLADLYLHDMNLNLKTTIYYF